MEEVLDTAYQPLYLPNFDIESEPVFLGIAELIIYNGGIVLLLAIGTLNAGDNIQESKHNPEAFKKTAAMLKLKTDEIIDDAYEYAYAHEIATKIEREYVESLGVNWDDYCKEVNKNLHEVYMFSFNFSCDLMCIRIFICIIY